MEQEKQNKQDKKTRLQAIRRIVRTQDLERQEELQQALQQEGFVCTQATLSRDLKQLRIGKMRTRSGRSVYALSHEGHVAALPTAEELERMHWRLSFSGNLMVIHTPPGHASMVAYDLDNLRCPYFLGTVAGDDTVLVVLAEGVSREAAGRMAREAVPGLMHNAQCLMHNE